MLLALSTQRLLNVSGQIVTNKDFKKKKNVTLHHYVYADCSWILESDFNKNKKLENSLSYKLRLFSSQTFPVLVPQHFSNLVILHTCPPMKVEQTECSETAAYKIQVKGKFSRYRPGVTQRVGRGIALFFHDRVTRKGWIYKIQTPGNYPEESIQQ